MTPSTVNRSASSAASAQASSRASDPSNRSTLRRTDVSAGRIETRSGRSPGSGVHEVSSTMMSIEGSSRPASVGWSTKTRVRGFTWTSVGSRNRAQRAQSKSATEQPTGPSNGHGGGSRMPTDRGPRVLPRFILLGFGAPSGCGPRAPPRWTLRSAVPSSRSGLRRAALVALVAAPSSEPPAIPIAAANTAVTASLSDVERVALSPALL